MRADSRGKGKGRGRDGGGGSITSKSGAVHGGRGSSGRGTSGRGKANRMEGKSAVEGRSGGRWRDSEESGNKPRVEPRGPAIPIRSGRRKGEWFEVRLPESYAGLQLHHIMKQVEMPAKIAGKLFAAKGADKQGNMLRLRLFPLEKPEFPPDWMELNILYEDDFTLVVNKPAGYEVHPSVAGQRGTLAHAVAAYYDMTNQPVRVRHIHRLDKETTGPVLYAKNELAHYVFDEAMRSKRIERVYLAVVEGLVEQDRGVVDAPIGQDRHHSTRRRVSETGEQAITRYQVVERFGEHTLVRLQLETGRTHQIRVHMAHLGHPLAGDGMYGGNRRYISRQALHGEKLVWVHPLSGERMTVRAPLPEDMGRLLDKLRDEMK